MNYFLYKRGARYCTIVAATLQLWACGGGGESPPPDTRATFDDTAVSTTVSKRSGLSCEPTSTQWVARIPSPSPAPIPFRQFVNPDTLQVWVFIQRARDRRWRELSNLFAGRRQSSSHCEPDHKCHDDWCRPLADGDTVLHEKRCRHDVRSQAALSAELIVQGTQSSAACRVCAPAS